VPGSLVQWVARGLGAVFVAGSTLMLGVAGLSPLGSTVEARLSLVSHDLGRAARLLHKLQRFEGSLTLAVEDAENDLAKASSFCAGGVGRFLEGLDPTIAQVCQDLPGLAARVFAVGGSLGSVHTTVQSGLATVAHFQGEVAQVRRDVGWVHTGADALLVVELGWGLAVGARKVGARRRILQDA
jgi:hypothetical protein